MQSIPQRSVNLLYPIFATLTSHLYDPRSPRPFWLMDYYLSVRELDVPGSTPLRTLYPTLPRPLKLTLAKILLFTAFPRLGFFGTAAEPAVVEALQRLVSRLEKDKDALCPASFASIMRLLHLRPDMKPLLRYDARISEKTILRRAEKLIAENNFTAFSINKHATGLAKTTKLFLSLARCAIPKHRTGKPTYHSNLFKNAFLTAEIALPQDLLADIRQSYTRDFRTFIPTCIFYSLCYQTTLGVNLVPSVESMGFLLGFRGPPAARFSYIRSFGDLLGTKVSEKYDLRYDRVLDVVFHGSTTDEAFTVDPRTKRVVTLDLRDLPKRDNPFRSAYVRNGEALEEVLGKSRGTYILDHTSVHYGEALSPTDHRYQFPYEVRFLTPRSRMTRSLENSAFTSNKAQIRAFHSLVEVNEITKPDLNKRPKAKDNRWQPIFDEYLASDFSLSSLATILKHDHVFFSKVQPKLRKLQRALNGKSLYDLTSDDLCKIAYEGFGTGSHGIEKPYNVLDDDERYQMSLLRNCIDLWLKEFKDPTLPGDVTITIRKLKTEGAARARTVCRQPILLSIFESFTNRVWQIIFQKINRDVLGYAVSNYLPGLAVPLYTMERLADELGGRDFTLCNMDVKSCFDNVNLAHPNFLACLEDGLRKVEELVSPEAGGFLRYLFKDYLHRNLTQGKFKFQKSKQCSKKQKVEIPSFGTLPTGFVLSPALWLTLALPALVETKARQREGKLFGFDLCGDDLIALAPRDLSVEDKEQVCAPWFALAERLDLKFHFFKNYKDKRVHFDERWNYLFEGKTAQESASAWATFPANSVPLFHAGTVLLRKSYVETVAEIDKDKAEGKFYAALGKRKRAGEANFLPQPIMDSLKDRSSLVSRVASVNDVARLRDQGDKERETQRFLTGAQSPTMEFFLSGTPWRGGTHTGRAGVSKAWAWVIQAPVAPRIL